MIAQYSGSFCCLGSSFTHLGEIVARSVRSVPCSLLFRRCSALLSFFSPFRYLRGSCPHASSLLQVCRYRLVCSHENVTEVLLKVSDVSFEDCRAIRLDFDFTGSVLQASRDLRFLFFYDVLAVMELWRQCWRSALKAWRHRFSKTLASLPQPERLHE
jgi:hypothetical protein